MVAVVLAIVFVALRISGTLGPQAMRWTLPLGFVLMTAAPWVFLGRAGRRQIGLVRSHSGYYYPAAIIAGALMAGLCFAIGLALFGHGPDHFYSSIADSYRNTLETRGLDAWKLHLIFTLPALLFSPIGEELFFRGFLQQGLQEKFSVGASTILEAGLFALVHLCHHGVSLTAAGLVFLPWSGALWVVLMFATALVFAALRRGSGSLYPAIVAHMAFNAAMNWLIFAYLWR